MPWRDKLGHSTFSSCTLRREVVAGLGLGLAKRNQEEGFMAVGSL
jgi:hypothetical protein